MHKLGTKFEKFVASVVSEILRGSQNLKVGHRHVT